jgi:hypothetical protein
MAPPPPDQKTGPRVSPNNRGEVRQGEGHEHAFKKETVLTCVAVSRAFALAIHLRPDAAGTGDRERKSQDLATAIRRRGTPKSEKG